MSQAPQRATAMAEHIVNEAGQVMVLLPVLARRPTSWRAFPDGVVALSVPGVPPRFFSLTEQAMAMATAPDNGWLLVVEMGDRPEHETWVEIAA